MHPLFLFSKQKYLALLTIRLWMQEGANGEKPGGVLGVCVTRQEVGGRSAELGRFYTSRCAKYSAVGSKVSLVKDV